MKRRPHNGQPRLTDEQVRWTIRTLQTRLMSQHEIALRFRVSQMTIWRIWNKKSYKRVWEGVKNNPIKPLPPRPSSLVKVPVKVTDDWSL